ncbi:MAG: hypothetical protein AAF693_10600 [Bacteroidota bacterium]
MKTTIFIFLLSLGGNIALCQLDNTAFDQLQPILRKDSNAFHIGFNALGFTKNNEYFNDIADGFTLFGFQFNPYFSYQVGERFKFSGGLYLQQDFGNDDFNEIAPTFTAQYTFLNGRVLFGTLGGATSHQLIEPLFDFERVLVNRLENGFQFKIDKPDFFFDLWVDWQNMIYPGDNDQEEVTAGLSFRKKIAEAGDIKFTLPFQALVFHRGGQIDSSPLPLQTYLNAAFGLIIDKPISISSFVRDLRLEGYHVFYGDYSNTLLQTFEDGDGLYLNASVKTSIHLDLMASYWRGNEFISIQGGQLYPSVSSTFKDPDAVEQQRELLIFRFLHTLKIADHIYVSTRFEPHVDLGNGEFEFSHGFYLNYRPQFFVSRLKDRR